MGEWADKQMKPMPDGVKRGNWSGTMPRKIDSRSLAFTDRSNLYFQKYGS
jgi:hypothetical protein